MRAITLSLILCALFSLPATSVADSSEAKPVMLGVPPSTASQVTFGNYREHPYNQWAFRNIGAPLNVLMVPRAGPVHVLSDTPDQRVAHIKVQDATGNTLTVDKVFEQSYADGVLVLKGDNILFEKYFNGLSRDYQHIWFSATKSLASTAFGILVEQGKVDLNASPAKYIPELKGSGFERVTIQNVLNHSTSLAFKENYTDPNSEFFKYYAPALNMGKMPGARDAEPQDNEIYGVHDFLAKFIRPNEEEKPGDVFDYNSANADVLGWLIARISGMPFDRFIQQHIWSKLGAEHDAYIAIDRAYAAVATGGMNTTLRDAARFGSMILNRGKYNGQQIVPAQWVDETLNVSAKDKNKMRDNAKYQDESWTAYKNMWWVLNAKKGEYAAVGIHGQVIYINRENDIVIAWFSSQPVASAAGNEPFRLKLRASQAIAAGFSEHK